MKTVNPIVCFALLLSLAVVGCKEGRDKTNTANNTNNETNEAEIQADLAKLDPGDKKLAEDQKFCVVEEENRLGSMGKPFKLMVKDQPVFLCCKGCQRKALADPDKTVAKAKELRTKNTGSREK